MEGQGLDRTECGSVTQLPGLVECASSPTPLPPWWNVPPPPLPSLPDGMCLLPHSPPISVH